MKVSLNKKLLSQYSTPKVKVYTVNQTAVCKHYTIKFIGGGHGLVYPELPKNEIWIAEHLHTPEKEYFIYHELFEYNKMLRGLDYDTAHVMANRAEGKVRHGDFADLDNLIKVEMDKNRDIIPEPSLYNGVVHLHNKGSSTHHSHHWKTVHSERRLSTLRT